MKKYKVSVIIPVYNGEKYLSNAIESVLRQEILCEIIIVNDCSTDGTEAVVEQYIHLEQVHYLKNKRNRGVAYSRNRGVKESRGEYVAFLDADDWWEETKLKKQLQILKGSSAVLCSTARELFDEDGKSTGRIIPVPKIITYKRLLRHNCIACSSVIMKREIALEFPQEYDKAHEDYIMWLNILKKYPLAVGINEPLLKYRLCNTGKSGNKLKSAKMTYQVYRYVGCSQIQAAVYFLSYAIHGVIKYMGI